MEFYLSFLDPCYAISYQQLQEMNAFDSKLSNAGNISLI